MKRIFTALLFVMTLGTVLAQPPTSIQPFAYTPDPGFTDFNTSQYQSFVYYRSYNGWDATSLPFRILLPKNYDPSGNTKYPLVIMLHGAGEGGDDNDHQLKHGGKEHLNAVNSGAFPGFVLFPQEPYGSWTSGNPEDTNSANQLQQRYLPMTWGLVDSLLFRYKIDQDRVFIHGLSSGGTGSLASLYHRPDIFAGALPMSAAATIGSLGSTTTQKNVSRNMGIVAPIPVWWFQGGLDINPPQSVTDFAVGYLRDSGAINTTELSRYKIYPTTYHDTWLKAYVEPDFFPWMLRQNKRKPYLMGPALVCDDQPTIIGFSKGFYNYQWYKDGVPIPGANKNKLWNITEAGVYHVVCTRRRQAPNGYVSNTITIQSVPTVTYFSKSTGNLQDKGTWGTNANGSGANPSDFTTNGQIFVVTNRSGGATLSSNWTVSGCNSKVLVNNGQKLTVSSGAVLQAKMQLKANSEVVFETVTLPTLVAIDPTSTVTFNTTSTIPDVSYGNVHLKGTATKTFATDSVTINGDLVVENALTLQGHPTGIRLYGNLTIQDTSAQFVNVSLVLKNQAHKLDGKGGKITLATLSLPANSKVKLANSSKLHLGTATGGGLYPGQGSVLSLDGGLLSITGKGALNPLDKTSKIAAKSAVLRLTTTTTSNSYLYVSDTACAFKEISLYNNGGASLFIKDSLNLTGTLKLGAGACNTNGHLVLVSNLAGTARIAKVETGASLIGEVRWQRLVGPDKTIGYFTLCNPILAQKLVGMKKTIPSINGLSNGGYPSISFRNENTGGWISIKDSNTIMQPGKGYRVIVKTSDLVYSNNSAFYQFKGAPVIGNGTGDVAQPFVIPIANTVGGTGWNLIGNPFPSEIDWDAAGWDKSNIEDSYTVWDAKNSNYKSYAGGIGTLGLTSVINAGQAFMVKAKNNNVGFDLKLTEEVKVVPSTNVAFYRLAEEDPALRITMTNNEAISNQAIVRFNDSSNKWYDKLDAPKLFGTLLNISTPAGADAYAINALPYYDTEVSVPLYVQASKGGDYVLQFTGTESFPDATHLYLHDKEKNRYVDVRKEKDYSFNFTASFDDKTRFELVFDGLPTDQVLSYQNGAILDQGVQVFPNPTHSDLVNFRMSSPNSQDVTLEIYNIEGNEVYKSPKSTTGEQSTFQWNIDKEKIASGMYFYKISSGSNVYDGKIVVQ